MTDIQSETQKHVIGVFKSVEGNETSHIIDGEYSKYITIIFISDALDWCCGEGWTVSTTDEGFLLMSTKKE